MVRHKDKTYCQTCCTLSVAQRHFHPVMQISHGYDVSALQTHLYVTRWRAVDMPWRSPCTWTAVTSVSCPVGWRMEAAWGSRLSSSPEVRLSGLILEISATYAAGLCFSILCKIIQFQDQNDTFLDFLWVLTLFLTKQNVGYLAEMHLNC